jgi:ABC-2 type transport system permease protein
MSWAVFRVMLLGLIRDRGALAMTFLVPSVFFLVFASIFAASSGGNFRPRVAVGYDSGSPWTGEFVTELRSEDALDITRVYEDDADSVRDLVRHGRVDVGLLIESDPDNPDRPGFVIVHDPARNVASQILTASIQRAYAVTFVIPKPAAGQLPSFAPTIDIQAATGGAAGSNEVAYSAGAVALLFLLLSAVHGAVSLFEERDSGIIERLVAGPAGTRPLVDGKFLYLTVLGIVQIFVIFALAWLVYGVNVPSRWLPWLVISVAAAASAAGLALALTTLFPTRHQALTFANVTVLIMCALGGSMIPRFLMPPLLRQAGWVTPNAWALEAYTSIFWRGDPLTALGLPLSLLAVAALVGLMLARRNARRLEAL